MGGCVLLCTGIPTSMRFKAVRRYYLQGTILSAGAFNVDIARSRRGFSASAHAQFRCFRGRVILYACVILRKNKYVPSADIWRNACGTSE